MRLDGVRVLVVDDDRDAVALGEAILTAAGAQRSHLAVGDRGPEHVPRWRPDVLVSDIEMPGEDGYSLIRKVRAQSSREEGRRPRSRSRRTGGRRTATRSLAAGTDMHVPKPVDPGELTTVIAAVAHRQDPASESASSPGPSH